MLFLFYGLQTFKKNQLGFSIISKYLITCIIQLWPELYLMGMFKFCAYFIIIQPGDFFKKKSQKSKCSLDGCLWLKASHGRDPIRKGSPGPLGEDLHPSSRMQVLAGLNVLGTAWQGPVPHWLLAGGLWWFPATWVSPVDSLQQSSWLFSEQVSKVMRIQDGSHRLLVTQSCKWHPSLSWHPTH